MDQQALKVEIKRWEHEFREKEGRNPQKEDIKKDASIAAKYKMYNTIKMKVMKALKADTSIREPLTPTKNANHLYSTPQKSRKPTTHLNTPQQTSPPSAPSPVVKMLGPTPQLNGRVLSIFEAITANTPIKTTPTKTMPQITIEEPYYDEFQTPTKKRLDFSSFMRHDVEGSSAVNSSSPVEEPAQLPSSPAVPFTDAILSKPIFKTPQKNTAPNMIETPAYLKSSNKSHVVTASPSPLASQRIKKGLTTLIAELQDIQEDLKYGDYDEFDYLEAPSSSDSEHEETNEDDQVELIEDKGQAKWKRKKRKGPKRQHRLVHIKPLPSGEEDTAIDIEGDVKEQIKNIVQKDEIEVLESDESEEWSDDGNDYVRQKVDYSLMKGKRKPAGVSRNFKAYKLKRRGGGGGVFGKRSKGW
ncbi:CYFA0S11e03136g1_1 [Cyberlindnera fabianii]|uniref:DNA replication regulator SLD2 n=1 Tax=Cyberlindnera fabianii TaxID=36022 RepID=A0A061B1B6_CYBFA|nr:CYFA0S11e03136g1_1 [Cyberlindnera fabianii]